MAEAYERGAEVFFEIVDPTLRRAQLLGATREQLDLEMTWRLARVKEMDARLYILAGQNLSEHADVPPERMQQFDLARKPVMDEGLKKKWALLRFPTSAASTASCGAPRKDPPGGRPSP